MEEFKIGDVVYLKSGGPAMTVSYVEDNSVEAQWFDEKNKVDFKNFPKATITKTKPGSNSTVTAIY